MEITIEPDNVIWIGTDGYVQECKVIFESWNRMHIGLYLDGPCGRKCDMDLYSRDGFRFEGGHMQEDRRLFLRVAMYRCESRAILFGTWCDGNDCGELAIHAHMNDSTLFAAGTRQMVNPAAWKGIET